MYCNVVIFIRYIHVCFYISVCIYIYTPYLSIYMYQEQTQSGFFDCLETSQQELSPVRRSKGHAGLEPGSKYNAPLRRSRLSVSVHSARPPHSLGRLRCYVPASTSIHQSCNKMRQVHFAVPFLQRYWMVASYLCRTIPAWLKTNSKQFGQDIDSLNSDWCETMLKSRLFTKFIEGTGFGIRLFQELPLVPETASTAMVPSWFAMPKMQSSYAHVRKWGQVLNHKYSTTVQTSSTLAVEPSTSLIKVVIWL